MQNKSRFNIVALALIMFNLTSGTRSTLMFDKLTLQIHYHESPLAFHKGHV